MQQKCRISAFSTIDKLTSPQLWCDDKRMWNSNFDIAVLGVWWVWIPESFAHQRLSCHPKGSRRCGNWADYFNHRPFQSRNIQTDWTSVIPGKKNITTTLQCSGLWVSTIHVRSHCRKMLYRSDQICGLQWLSKERQIWLPMAGASCTGWSNLRYTGRIYDFRRYIENFY